MKKKKNGKLVKKFMQMYEQLPLEDRHVVEVYADYLLWKNKNAQKTRAREK